MTLSIVIVNWNVRPLLERCVSSIFKSNKELDFEIIIIDNNSTDGSQEYLSALNKKRRKLKIILNKNNLGFATANNQGIEQAKGEFILLLNPDTEVYNRTLQKMVDFMRKTVNCGIVGCQLIGVDDVIQPSIRKFPTVASQSMILSKFQYLFPNARFLRDYYQYDFDYSKRAEVDQVWGACLMTRRKVIEEVGMLDERFFLWFEEVDFNKRARNAGWKVFYIPEARILHHGSQSFAQILALSKQRIYSRSALYYFRKHFSKKSYWPLIILHPISLFMAYFAQIFIRLFPTRYEFIKKKSRLR